MRAAGTSVNYRERIEDLEEQLENGRHQVENADRVVKKAEEELAVAKERLLLQENELQSKSEELLSQSSSQVRVSAEVEELRSQLSRLNIRNKELELQNSGRTNDHARMLKQHADALSSMRLELQRAHAEEIRRLHQEVEKERGNDRQELEEEKKRVQHGMEEEKVRLKEQLRKALEEVIRKHASELRQTNASLEVEKKKCQQAEEQKKAAEEERRTLETERDELHKQLQLSVTEISRLEAEIHRLEEEKEEAQKREQEGEQQRERERERQREREEEISLQPPCGLECERVRQELEHTHTSLQQIEVECETLRSEILALRREKEVLQQSNHGTEERIRLQFEKHFSDHVADLQKEREKEIRDINLHWQLRVQELQTQLEERSALSERSTQDGERERCYGNGEMERMKLEIQKTREMNSSLRAQLHSTIQEKERLMKKQQLQVVQEEDEDEEAVREDKVREEERDERGWRQREDELLRVERLSHQRALQALESRASEELQAEKQRLHTQHKLQLEKQKAELTQQHTEWVRQVTQRHMQQIEDLQTELQTHTQMMALQQDLKQQNRVQSLERQLDERSSEVQELKRENEELRERVNALRMERESSSNLKHTSSSWKEMKDECRKRDVMEESGDGAQGEMETVKKEHRMEIQTIMSDFSSAQTQLQARIVALETELREREEKGKRRVEDLHTIAKLQDKLSDRDQLIKRLVEDLHQLSQHPPLGRDGTVKPQDSRLRPGNLTPAVKKMVEDVPPRVTSVPNLSSLDGGSPKATRSPSMEQQGSRGLPSSEQGGRGVLLSRTHAPTSPHTEARAAARHIHSPIQDLQHQLHLNYSQHIRTPSEQRVIETGPDPQDPQRQEWFTKYFSF
ncbi:hypothetical protein SRHO_G00256020 [Serrasalmus rhombeus]